MTAPLIAFLGIGLMGAPMATLLAQAGYHLSAWNRSYDKAEALRHTGAILHVQLNEALADADIVISMLASGAAVAEVLDAALPSLKPDTLWIDMSSTQHAEALTFHRRLIDAGHHFVDAPVSGGVVGAAAATLAIMAGGSAADFARAEPVLRVMGRPTLVGPAGSGQVAKLCNQLIVGGTLNIVAEALLLAQATGADPAAVRAAIRGGFAESRVLELQGGRMLERDFMPGGKVRTQLKDLRNVLIAAADAGVVLPMTALAAERFGSIEQEHPGADHTAALLAVEKLNPGFRVGEGPDRLPS